MTKTAPSNTLTPKAKPVIVELSSTPEKFLGDDFKSSQPHSQECLYPYLEKKNAHYRTEVHHQLPPSTAPVEVTLSATPEKFLEDDLKSIQLHSQGCLYPYLEKKKLLDGSIVFYPRVIGQRDPDNPIQWRWGFNWEERVDGLWKGRSIGSIPPGAVHMIRLMQQQGATKEDIIAFIKKAKSKKPSPKLDICKNFDNTKIKPVLPDDASIAVVLFAGGGGIEAGMVQAGIRPVIAVEFDPSKPELSRAIAKTHHHNFSEYGYRIIQLTVQEVARLGFLGFPHRPDYLHASQYGSVKNICRLS
ncbi:hypothetical protein [Nostoc flagelliforme]|uniref:hypothetical protein n=1 Tax=Nostoc flagelliforme TaxID=1306274 RepID=UPI001F54922A|nr:hypothetical protein [Nostoc flagelliforme]